MNKKNRVILVQFVYIFVLLVFLGGMCYFVTHYTDKDFVPAAQTNAVAVATATETNLVPSGTNGLTIVNDVGGTISFQQSSSRISAPVAPENPYLKK